MYMCVCICMYACEFLYTWACGTPPSRQADALMATLEARSVVGLAGAAKRG